MVHVPSPPTLVVRTQPPRYRWREWTTWGLLWLASLMVVAAAVWFLRERIPAEGNEPLSRALDQNASLQQRVAVLERAEQVAHTASADLQRQIGERQEEIAGLRADLAFYSRLTSTGATREGLSVQNLHLDALPGMPRMYNFNITLAQNLKPGQISSGRVKISVSGRRGDQLVTLDWNDLAQNQDANGLAFSFKYFQQIKGTLLLPEGFAPNAVHVDADGGAELGKTTHDSDWAQALATPGVPNAGK